MKQRLNAVAIITNTNGEYLLLKTGERAVYPNQWGIIGGGVNEGETIEDALRREVREESGLELSRIEAFWFQDDVRVKPYADGHSEEVYMIYLLFECGVETTELHLNDEWTEYAWVKPTDIGSYDLNAPTIKTFTRKGLLS